MPRTARILPSSAMLHLIGRGNNDTKLFRNRRDFSQFKRILFRYTDKQKFFIHHYSLMHTHYHLLAWIEDTNILPLIIKPLCISYHHYYTRRYEYKGHLWHSRFKSIIIRDESQLLQCGRYIELNAVYAGICGDPCEYAWSSYRYYAIGKKDCLLRPIFYPMGEVKHALNQENQAYREFVLSGIDLEYQRLKKQFEKEKFRRSHTKFQKLHLNKQ